MTDFKCDGCGACCRNLNVLQSYGINNNGKFAKLIADFPYKHTNGVCEMFDTITNKCTVYENRPIVCNVKKLHDVCFPTVPLSKWYSINEKGCNVLKRLKFMKKTPVYAIVDIKGNIILINTLEYLQGLCKIMNGTVFDVTEADEVLYGDHLHLTFYGKVRVTDLANTEVCEHRYYIIVNIDTNEHCVVFAYRNPDLNNELGFGFNTADGGSFLPLWDLRAGSLVVPITILLDVPNMQIL